MSLVDDVRDNKMRLNDIADFLKMADSKSLKKDFKIPRKVRNQRKARKGFIAVLFMRNNHRVDWLWAQEEGGIMKIKDKYYGFDNTAVYFDKKYPIMVVYEWRLIPAGGSKDKVLPFAGGEADKKVAESLGIETYAEKTIIRAIEKVEIEREDKKKKKFPIILIVIIIGIIIYLVSRFLG